MMEFIPLSLEKVLGDLNRFKNINDFIAHLESITADAHEPFTVGHAYESNPELPGICLHCGWIHPDIPCVCTCGDSLREHILYVLQQLKDVRDGTFEPNITITISIEPKKRSFWDIFK